MFKISKHIIFYLKKFVDLKQFVDLKGFATHGYHVIGLEPVLA